MPLLGVKELTTSHSESNRDKSKVGAQLQESIRLQLEELQSDNLITNFRQKVNVSEKGFSYKEAYLANFLIEVDGQKFIVVRTTNSFRADRLKQYLYDLKGITANSEFSDKIIASIFLLPNEATNDPGFKSFRQRFLNEEQYCPFDHCFLLDEFLKFIETFSLDQELDLETQKQDLWQFDSPSFSSDISGKALQGSFLAKRGNEFVRELVDQLKSKENLIF